MNIYLKSNYLGHFNHPQGISSSPQNTCKFIMPAIPSRTLRALLFAFNRCREAPRLWPPHATLFPIRHVNSREGGAMNRCHGSWLNCCEKQSTNNELFTGGSFHPGKEALPIWGVPARQWHCQQPAAETARVGRLWSRQQASPRRPCKGYCHQHQHCESGEQHHPSSPWEP